MFKKIKIGGVEPASMLERPGKISTIVFLVGCNFRCPFCHNPELIENTNNLTLYPIEEFFKILKQKKDWVDSIIFTGGEPTIHGELPDLIKVVKEQGFETGLHTNGTNPEMLEKLLNESLLDYISLDVKSGENKYAKATGVENLDLNPIKKSINLLKKASRKVESVFRTTFVPKLLEEKDIHEIAKLIKGGRKASLQQFRPIRCLDKEYEKLTPYEKETLSSLADFLEEYVDEVERDFI